MASNELERTSKKKTPKKEALPKLQLSVSSIETFQSCPAKWYYRYIEKLPAPKNYYSAAGSFIHKILEVLILKYKSTKNLRKAGNVAFKAACTDPELEPYITSEIREEGKNWLKTIVKKFETDPKLIPATLSTETPFVFKINDDSIQVTVRGIIDRIDKVDDNTIKIVDYKTSKDPSSLGSFQLATYKVAMRQRYPNSDIKTSYVLIRHDFLNKEVNITPELESEVHNTFLQKAHEILDLKNKHPNEPWQVKTSKLCDYCPYKSRCETDRLKKSPWKL